ncbi:MULTISPECIES: hypothetical protein [Gammaproteobacteria]|uniref:Uncharacterized protein n=2 Tax=Gammaproteobacteria TaxID=1236 RepID=A0AAX3NYJ4_9GAMM|nr:MULTISPECIES: hypothetical protein [Gammaproteobacteria]MDV0844441.1 hypothetical protein [Klebsiella quasipneumoniae subsp. quasipneumoniae]WED79204.1 hypothetical protein PYU98_24945 [Aeromonas allosaccharophila]
MEKLHLKDGYSIYFADVYFDDVIYSMGTGLGFTDVIYGYSLGRDQQEAEQLVTEKYNGKVSAKPNGDEVRVKKVYLRLARSQDINRYTFPENMAGYSHAIQ